MRRIEKESESKINERAVICVYSLCTFDFIRPHTFMGFGLLIYQTVPQRDLSNLLKLFRVLEDIRSLETKFYKVKLYLTGTVEKERAKRQNRL